MAKFVIKKRDYDGRMLIKKLARHSCGTESNCYRKKYGMTNPWRAKYGYEQNRSNMNVMAVNFLLD